MVWCFMVDGFEVWFVGFGVLGVWDFWCIGILVWLKLCWKDVRVFGVELGVWDFFYEVWRICWCFYVSWGLGIGECCVLFSLMGFFSNSLYWSMHACYIYTSQSIFIISWNFNPIKMSCTAHLMVTKITNGNQVFNPTNRI